MEKGFEELSFGLYLMYLLEGGKMSTQMLEAVREIAGRIRRLRRTCDLVEFEKFVRSYTSKADTRWIVHRIFGQVLIPVKPDNARFLRSADMHLREKQLGHFVVVNSAYLRIGISTFLMVLYSMDRLQEAQSICVRYGCAIHPFAKGHAATIAPDPWVQQRLSA